MQKKIILSTGVIGLVFSLVLYGQSSNDAADSIAIRAPVDPKELVSEHGIDEGEVEIPVSIETVVKAAVKEVDKKEKEAAEDTWNMDFTDARAYLNRKTGKVRLVFHYDGDGYFRETQENLGPSSLGVGPQPLLIRFFDVNGRYLTHFMTAERFAPWDMDLFKWRGYWEGKIAKGKNPAKYGVLKSLNDFTYEISTREAAYVGGCQLGWYSGKRLVWKQDDGSYAVLPKVETRKKQLTATRPAR